MANKINIAEILKDCSKGMELDCTICDNVVFDSVQDDIIHCAVGDNGDILYLDQYGRERNCWCTKCIIFPKGKTTWEGFHRPFKDGDVVATSGGTWIGIASGYGDGRMIPTHCVIRSDNVFEAYLNIKNTWMFNRLATEAEKQKLFDAIKANGYKWIAETKTLEKLIEPKFKVGDRIKYKNGKNTDGVEQGVILSITNDTYDVAITNDIGIFVPIADQDKYELVPNKFDINTLKPFDKVLVRTKGYHDTWICAFFSYKTDYEYSPYWTTADKCYQQCIPYEGNEHLLGTTDDCDEFYKTWE